MRVTGWVESVLPFLHEAAIYIAPLRMGSGTRLKILEAMAAGCAVVSTSIGAAGLNEETRGALLIADGEQDFADAVSALLADEERRREMGALAQRQVKKHYDWSAADPASIAGVCGAGTWIEKRWSGAIGGWRRHSITIAIAELAAQQLAAVHRLRPYRAQRR